MLQWPLQFCESKRVNGAAEAVASPEQLGWLDQNWLSSAVPMVPGTVGKAARWDALVTEVKRLGERLGKPQ
jgi:hypothetical protein